jgi:hypothetical protein
VIKRPLNSRFSGKVLDGTKFTTIRENPWPLWTPIMLYNWRAQAYRSPQDNVCPVIVESETEILISNTDGTMTYLPDSVDGIPLYQTEGFNSMEELDDWFRPLVKPGQTVTKHLMRFKKLSTSTP